ncbi:helix-turn-helix domain-containing protein [Insolitispirillum peregrinum]|uniref:Helix-turn-helix domain-containing protein n=1 Tax=Insolitispirillum peregrinum TaxID=80876 RepID=A0A1N7MGC2_9PROT|nr:helix-turn-helix domain-containing protein [Insolitispirillum peregrinum]SIS85077.1 Helix-turn-helix domain-containing protein [Insolitispirillum peregrinum]
MADDDFEDWDDNPDWSDYPAKPLDAAGQLLTARARLGLSQKEMASLLGISIGTLRNWEQRRTDPDGPGKALISLIYRHPEEICTWLSVA